MKSSILVSLPHLLKLERRRVHLHAPLICRVGDFVPQNQVPLVCPFLRVLGVSVCCAVPPVWVFAPPVEFGRWGVAQEKSPGGPVEDMFVGPAPDGGCA